MSVPKTFYGPWVEKIPTDVSDASVWEATYVFEDGDAIECHVVAFKGCLIDEDAITVDREHIQKARRIYPPGSILPEPRPVLENRRIRDLSGSAWWAIKLDGSWRFVETAEIEENRDVLYLERHPRPWTVTASTRCYPVQHFADGIFVPRPWPDSGCTTE